MMYISTRGNSPKVNFEDALLAGLAPDGGLYMPENWPKFTAEEISALAGLPFADVALHVLHPFIGGTFSKTELHDMCTEAFASFSHTAVTPLVQVDDEDWILELFHGPTLAFKDVAMQLLGVMFEKVLSRQSRNITIIGATSGDTGGAAIEALQNRAGVNVFILHPEGRISEVQRRIMTTSGAANIANIALQGTFDDCQAIVKSLFADHDFTKTVSLGGVNSINWARIAIQTVYYFTAATALGAPARELSFVVPTGNFGDIFAGFVARKMGLPIKTLCAATNTNDIVHRVINSGNYCPSDVRETTSPSMDIQIASNFERLIFEACNRDSAEVLKLMDGQKQSGKFSLSNETLKTINTLFSSNMATEEEVSLSLANHLNDASMLIDPHTAVGRVVAKKERALKKLSGPVVTLATAHPAKFPEAVMAATGRNPDLPRTMSDLFERPETMMKAPNDTQAIKSIILKNYHANV